MQWRLLLRRCPLRSFTVVGDIAQAASASASSTWRQALRTLVGNSVEGDRWRLEELTVNYRTPSQISAVAERMAIVQGLSVTPSTAVRQSEWPIRLTAALLEAVTYDRGISSHGTLAVIAPVARVDAAFAELDAALPGIVGAGANGLSRPIAVLTPQDAKGLEFDSVVIVEPAEILVETERGAGALYVAMTRPTQRLALVTADGTVPDGVLPL